MKPYQHTTAAASCGTHRAHWKTTLLVATIALLPAAGSVGAAEKTIRTANGDVTVLEAPRGTQQNLKASGLQPHPFATAKQRAAAKPMLWNDEAKPEKTPLDRAAQPKRPPGAAAGGSAPPFANYQARNDFPEAWKTLEAIDANQAKVSPDGKTPDKDGAHYGYWRFPGNYYTSQWLAPPWNKIGKLYFTTPSGGSSYCTANLASGNSVLVTAAHCVYTRGQGFNGNFVFVPAERFGAAPYGTYGWSSASVMSSWISDGGRRWDVAVIRLAGESSTGQPATNYVGWLGRSWNYGYSNFLYSHGYASNLSTQYTNICAGQTYDSAWEGTNVLVQGCDMTYGSSGGGWLLDYQPNSHGGNYVNSVVSGPHIGDFGQSYVGARFNDDNIVPLCNAIGC